MPSVVLTVKSAFVDDAAITTVEGENTKLPNGDVTVAVNGVPFLGLVDGAVAEGDELVGEVGPDSVAFVFEPPLAGDAAVEVLAFADVPETDVS